MLIFALNMDFSPPTNEVWDKLIFSEACVKNSVHRGRGVPGQIPPSQIRYRPGLGTTTPGPGTSPWDQVHSPGTRYTPLGPGTPLDQVHTPTEAVQAGRYGQQVGGTHPTGMHSCFFCAYYCSSQ